MYSVSGVSNRPPFSITKECIITALLGTGFTLGGWVGIGGATVTYLIGRTIYRSCASETIEKIRLRFFRPCQKIPEPSELKKREFLRRIPEGKWKRLIKQIEKLNVQVRADAIDAFRFGHWTHPIFQNSQWPLLAFRAYLQGILEEKYLPKLLLFDACRKEAAPGSRVRAIQLINSERMIDGKALAIFKRGLEPYYSKKQILAVAKKLREFPPETSQFFEVQHLKKNRDLFEAVIHTRFHPFLRESLSENHYIQQVIPPELLKIVLEVRFEATTREPRPVLGFFQKERMSTLDSRVVSLSLANLNLLPPTLHGFQATPLRHYGHDGSYHLFIDSANVHLEAWSHLAQFVKKNGEIPMSVRIFDGDFPAYRCTIKARSQKELFYGQFAQNEAELFWATLISVVLVDSPNTPEKAVDLAWEYLEEHSEEWDRKYGLGIEGLQRFLGKTGLNIQFISPDPLLPILTGRIIAHLKCKTNQWVNLEKTPSFWSTLFSNYSWKSTA
jgi:hypothetical protein